MQILTPDAASQLPPKSHLQLGSSALLEVDPTPSPDATTSSPSHHRSAKSRGASPHSKPPPRSNIPDTPDLPRTLEAPQSAKASRSPDSQQFPRPLATPRPPDPLQASWPATPELPSPLKAAQSAKAPKPPARQQTPNPSTTPQPPDPFQTNGPATPEVSSPLKAAQPAKAPKSLDPQPNPKPSRPPNPPNLLKERLCTLLAETAAPGGAFTGALTAFRSFRLTPRYGMVWGRKFESLTWSNAVLPNWPLCATEVLSGRCSEKGCEYQHAREYVLKEEGLLAQLRG